jgi:ATP-binding cassette subfamily B protein
MHGGWKGATSVDAFDSRRGGLKDFKILLRLLHYTTPYRGLVVLGLVTMIMYTATVVATPVIVLMAIDAIVPPEQSTSRLTVLVILFFVNAVLNYLTHYIHQVSMTRVSQNLLLDVRDDMFNHLQTLSMSFYDRSQMGRIMSRLQNDVFQIQEFLTYFSVGLGDLLTLVSIVIAMCFIDWTLALITLTVVPPLVVIGLIWQRFSWPRFMRVRTALAIVNGNLQENISGMRVIQSMNREEKNYQRFRGLNQNHREAQLSSQRFAASLMPSVEILSGTAMALVVIFGGLMTLNGALAVGVVVAFALYIQRFFEPVRNLTMQYTQMQRAMTSASHIFELIDEKPEIVDKPNAVRIPQIQGEVVFDNVQFRYTPDVEILKGINLKMNPGETIAVVGATGAGKTTLSALILRLYDVNEGSIRVDGYDVRDVNRASLVNQIGTVVQEPFLFSGSIRDNIRFNHPRVTDAQIVRAAKTVGAHEFIMRLEDGYDDGVEERGMNLSAGQRQLIALARALVFDPRIIILDEATASVDSQTETVIQEALGQVLKGRTALVIAHRLSTVRNADRVIVMDQGEIVEEGNHLQLLQTGGLYSKLYRMNFGENGASESEG